MVYPGSRSTGCGQCRKRKIKCDEARPACGRCRKSGLDCSGYYRPLELRFHTDGGQLLPSRSRKKAGRGNGSGSAGTPSPAGDGPEGVAAADPDRDDVDDDARHRHHQALLFLPPRLNQQPELLWEQESTLYFFNEYCISPNLGIFSGSLNFLPKIVLQSAAGSTLRAASSALACLALSRQSKSRHLYQRVCAFHNYGKALRGLKTALGSNASLIWNDETIASIMLMDLFEDLQGRPFKNPASHLTALIQVFSMRNITVLQAASLSPLYRWALMHIQIRSIYTGQTFDCVKVPKQDFSTEDLPSGLCLLVAQIGQFSSDWTPEGSDADDRGSIRQRQPADPLALEEAWRIQTQLDRWMDNLPPIVKRRTVTTSSGSETMTSMTRSLGNMWSFFDAALVVFYTAVMACCRAEREKRPTHVAASAEALSARARSRLTDSINAICKSIQYNTGEVDGHGRDVAAPRFKAGAAYYIILPLELVVHSRYSSPRHRELCNEALSKIRASHGLVLGDACEEMLL